MSRRRTLMRWIVGSSLNYRFLVVAVGALLMAFGIATLPSTRVDVFPEFAPPRVVIQTACLGLSTSDVESLVTVPLEQAFNGVEGLDDDAVEVRAAAVGDRADLRSGRRPAARPGSWSQERMTAVSATLPTWAAPPVMLAPGLGDRPRRSRSG